MAARLKFLDPAVFSNWLERSPIKPHWWVLILCALFILPAIFIRGTHYEEGTTIALARSIFEDHLWPGTFRYGERLIDRPHAVTWLLAGVGYLIGGLPVWVARIPTVLSLIGGVGLVYWLVRRYASAAAALFAVACLIASPMMLQKTITAESDVEVSLLLFAAFVLFWRGYEAGGPTVWGWIGIAATLAVSGLWKGPQPLGYFFLGVGAFLLLRRQWIFSLPRRSGRGGRRRRGDLVLRRLSARRLYNLGLPFAPRGGAAVRVGRPVRQVLSLYLGRELARRAVVRCARMERGPPPRAEGG